jgi:hypothetical protein
MHVEICCSKNGDRRFLCRNDHGHAYSEHQANPSSGGKVTIITWETSLGTKKRARSIKHQFG